MKKRKLEDHGLGRSPDNVSEVIFKHIQASDDRIAVIVTGAFFHDMLLDLIDAFLVDDDQVKENLFHSTNGNVSTYATLVDLGYLLGLIPSQARDWLKLVGHFRNHFAHKWGADSFTDLEASNDKTIRADIRKLRTFTYPSVAETHPQVETKQAYTLRENFIVLTGAILFSLRPPRLSKIKRLKKMDLGIETADNEIYLHTFMRKEFIARSKHLPD